MAMDIGGNSIPDYVENYGRGYKFVRPEILRRNGQGAAIVAGYSKIEWTFDYMTPQQYAWWRTTLLTGLDSKSFATSNFYNDLQVLTEYDSCVVLRPDYERISNGYYENVTVLIDQIRV